MTNLTTSEPQNITTPPGNSLAVYLDANGQLMLKDVNGKIQPLSNYIIIPSGITVVTDFNSLPNPTTVSGKFYWCQNALGTKLTGIYYSNGAEWEYSQANEIIVVNNYSALPDPTTVPNQFYWCSNSQGTSWLPGSLGGTYYSKGMYYSNGVAWEFIDVPYQATQTEVNAGTNDNKFVTPLTFENASKWSTKEDTVNKSNSDSDIASTIKFPTWNAVSGWVMDWVSEFFQPLLISGTNIKTLNGESLLGSGNLITGGANKQIFNWWGGNWSTPSLNLYYYIGFNGGAIETLPGSAGTTVILSMQGRNKGLFVAPFDCKIRRVIFTQGASGGFTGKFALASGLPNYNGTWNIAYTNVTTHLDEAISSVGYTYTINNFLVTDNITVPKGYVICPMLFFSAQDQAGKNSIGISVEIEEVV